MFSWLQFHKSTCYEMEKPSAFFLRTLGAKVGLCLILYETIKREIDTIHIHRADITQRSNSATDSTKKRNRCKAYAMALYTTKTEYCNIVVNRIEQCFCFVFWKICFVFWKLCFVFWKLCFVFWRLCFVFWRLCFVFSKLCFVFSKLWKITRFAGILHSQVVLSGRKLFFLSLVMFSIVTPDSGSTVLFTVLFNRAVQQAERFCAL